MPSQRDGWMVSNNMATLAEQQETAAAVLGRLAQKTWTENGAVLAQVDAGHIVAALEALRDDDRTRLDVLSHMTAVDYAPREPRFTMVYELYSVELHRRVRVKCTVADTGNDGELPVIDSAGDVYLAALWHERECYDLMGIRFKGHPDLRRIVLPTGWDGHPLRKEYPFDGKRSWKTGCNVLGSSRMEGDLGL